jgi:anti-sigma factor RsiW
MNRQIVEVGVNMVAHLLEEVVPAAEKANVRRKLKRLSAELMRLYEAIDASTPEPTILDALRADDERARANLAGIMALVLDGGASHPQLLEVIRGHRLARAQLDQHLINALLSLPQGLQPSRDDIH